MHRSPQGWKKRSVFTRRLHSKLHEPPASSRVPAAGRAVLAHEVCISGDLVAVQKCFVVQAVIEGNRAGLCLVVELAINLALSMIPAEHDFFERIVNVNVLATEALTFVNAH